MPRDRKAWNGYINCANPEKLRRFRWQRKSASSSTSFCVYCSVPGASYCERSFILSTSKLLCYTSLSFIYNTQRHWSNSRHVTPCCDCSVDTYCCLWCPCGWDTVSLDTVVLIVSCRCTCWCFETSSRYILVFLLRTQIWTVIQVSVLGVTLNFIHTQWIYICGIWLCLGEQLNGRRR